MMQGIVTGYAQLCKALENGAAHILCRDFTTEGEQTARVVIDHPVVIEGGGAAVDFGFEICSGGVTLRDLYITTSDFDHAVSAAGKNGRPGDCLAIEIRSGGKNEALPVVIENCTIRHEVLHNMNSAVYISDGCHVEIRGNEITVEDKLADKALERGGIFIGQGVSGHICGNRIRAARTGFPITPYGLRASLEHVNGPMELPPVEIRDNEVCSTYFAKLYVSGALFGKDGRMMTEDGFGARAALRDLAVRLWTQNTFVHIAGEAAPYEGVFVQPRLDQIAAGAPYYERYVFFDLEEGQPVRADLPATE